MNRKPIFPLFARRGILRFAPALLALPLLLLSIMAVPPAASPAPGPRLVILMVWDGLRPDSVTQSDTPSLYALAHEGAYFANHHAMFPSLTMVNAATLATANPPSISGINANLMYFGPLLAGTAPGDGGFLALARNGPVHLEGTRLLKVLDGPGGLKGGVLQVPSLAQQLMRAGGFAAIMGKSGPTFLFDDNADGGAAQAKALFASDDQAVPSALAQQLMTPAALKMAIREDPPFGDQDAYLGHLFVDRALPAAVAALRANRSALLVLWQHNPDISEHVTGVGTAADAKALTICDTNLGRLRAALKRLAIADQTDLIVVSDHGFATINVRVDLGSLLVKQGLKQSTNSDDVIIARNVGVDNLFLSPRIERADRARLLQKIVNFAAAQEWCGPIFSPPAPGPDRGYIGSIAGTFSQAWFSLFNPTRSPDLIISFRELPGLDNSKLVGPGAKAYVVDGSGMREEPNLSQPALHPMPGVGYSDTSHLATTGDGTHGSLGKYEMHNFCVAIGPDFRRAWVDHAPTSNLDVARTIAKVLGVRPGSSAGDQPIAHGRVMAEAFKDSRAPRAPHVTPVEVRLDLPGRRVITTIDVEQMGHEKYLNGSEVRRR